MYQIRDLLLFFFLLFTFTVLVSGKTQAVAFQRNLFLGISGSDVLELQKILNQNKDTRVAEVGPGSPGNETAYFGTLTRSAVKKFQEKYAVEILLPIGLSQGTGFVGQATIKKLKELSEMGVTLSGTPEIISVSPKEGKDGTMIVISGRNFTNKNTVWVGLDEFKDLSSLDGKTISVTVTSSLLRKIFPGFDALSDGEKERIRKNIKAPISHGVFVRNENGESNELSFLLTP